MRQLFLFVVGTLSVWSVASTIPNPIDYAGVADDFKVSEKDFSGDWAGGNSWRGTLCNGRYSYRSWTRGLIDRMDFALVSEGKVTANIDLDEVKVGVGGSFKGPESLCLEVGGSYAIKIDWAKIIAEGTFDDSGEGLTNLVIRVRETRLGHIDLGTWVPDWLEDLLTKVVNSGLKKVWSSHLGTWINQKINETLKGKFPPSP